MITELTELLPAVGFLALGIVLLTGGAEYLVRAAQTLGIRAGLSPLVVGLTIVAFSTSAPELVASLVAALRKSPDLSIGNVVGSNIANICLVLGIAALVKPLDVHEKVARVDTPLALFLTFVLAAFLELGGDIKQWEAGILVAGIIGYTTWRVVRKGPSQDLVDQDEIVEHQMKVSNLWLGPILILSIAVLSAGAYSFVEGARKLAEGLGVEERVIGLSVMALGTSLPEVATVIAAVRKNMFDMVVGNVVGSNIFNILSVVGFTGLLFPSVLSDLGIDHVDLLMFVGSAIVLVAVMLTRKSIGRPAGVALVASYLAYIVYLY